MRVSRIPNGALRVDRRIPGGLLTIRLDINLGPIGMGRIRVIDRQSVLDAAERVVVREGATHLTLDAVAAEAGISKASVIYDYKSKNALIKAVIERSVARRAARLRAAIDAQEAGPDRAMRGRLAAARSRSISDAERTVALNLVAALAHDPDLRMLIKQAYSVQMAEVAATAADARRAILTFLALEGLLLMEGFGLYSWPQDQRDQLVGDIGALLESDGANAPDVETVVHE
jgi:AcrR family transcriptional regulator